MRRVIIESPYAAGDVEANRRYARRCVADSLARGEAPIASHLLYTQPGILDDTIAEERARGMAAGWAWYAVADLCAVYGDHGLTGGMLAGIERAWDEGIPVDLRSLGRGR